MDRLSEGRGECPKVKDNEEMLWSKKALSAGPKRAPKCSEKGPGGLAVRRAGNHGDLQRLGLEPTVPVIL